MSTARLDFQSAVDRYGWAPNRGFLFGLPFLPGQSSNATTGVPTNGIAGFAPGALFFNVKSSSAGTMLYVNQGTNASATWTSLDGAADDAVQGVAGGYKLARVSMALDGTNPTPWATGLTTVVAATVCLTGTAAPGVGTSILTTNISSATVNVYAWMVTASSDTTLIASTGTENFYGIAIGT